MYWKQNPKTHVYVAAHRGWSQEYPENTMPAFQASIDIGVDQIETDVHMTKDGYLVLHHDHTFGRTVNAQGHVYEYTLAQIQEMDAGAYMGEKFNGLKVPQLRDLMELVKDHPTMTLDIELKDYPTEGREAFAYESCDKTLAMIDEYGFTDRVVINSWSGMLNDYVFRKYGKKYRQHVYYPVYSMTKGELDPYSYGYCACMFNQRSTDIATAEACAAMRARGVQPWAGAFVKDAETVAQAVACDVDLITTNYPDIVLAELRKLGRHP